MHHNPVTIQGLEGIPMTNRDLIRKLVRQVNKAPKEVLLRQRKDTSLQTEWPEKGQTERIREEGRVTRSKIGQRQG
jgi:hypothetical protein